MSVPTLFGSPIQPLIAERWSPYAFDDRRVAKEDLVALLEAARWSASAANEQPWSYFVATRDEPAEFARLLSCVEEVNLPWAKFAAVLMLGCARLTLEHTGAPYETAEHDLGLASANLVFEATARGLAVGYAGGGERLPDALRKEDLTRHPRKPLDAFVFSGSWAQASSLVAK